MMAPRTKRRRLTDPTDDNSNDICLPATQLDKDSWNGFCEIESEPVCWPSLLMLIHGANFLPRPCSM